MAGDTSLTSQPSGGYEVTGCTISRRQYEYASELNRERIASGQVTVLLEDYRNMPGHYDSVVSTGFFEHVGSAFWAEHFRKVAGYLKPGGVAMVQTMLCNKFDRQNAKRLNFFSKYIFPGGEFPSVGSFIPSSRGSRPPVRGAALLRPGLRSHDA